MVEISRQGARTASFVFGLVLFWTTAVSAADLKNQELFSGNYPLKRPKIFVIKSERGKVTLTSRQIGDPKNSFSLIALGSNKGPKGNILGSLQVKEVEDRVEISLETTPYRGRYPEVNLTVYVPSPLLKHAALRTTGTCRVEGYADQSPDRSFFLKPGPYGTIFLRGVHAPGGLIISGGDAEEFIMENVSPQTTLRIATRSLGCPGSLRKFLVSRLGLSTRDKLRERFGTLIDISGR